MRPIPSRRAVWLTGLMLVASCCAPARAEMFRLQVTGTTMLSGNDVPFTATIGVESPFPSMPWFYPSPYPASIQSFNVAVTGVPAFSLTSLLGQSVTLHGAPFLYSAEFNGIGYLGGSSLPGFGTFAVTVNNTTSGPMLPSLDGVALLTPGPGSEIVWGSLVGPGPLVTQRGTITGLKLTAANTPEPTGLALLALGAAGLAGRAWLRRRRGR